MSYITAEYWIQCARCDNEVVMVANVPSTGVPPKTKKGAFEAAKASGWGGSYSYPICPDCKEKKND
jgi:hypothetical protein